MRSSLLLVSFVALVSSLAACGGSAIRVVQETPTGGTVALQGDGDAAREKAEQYMGSQCPFGYEILRQQASDADRREQTIRYACRRPHDDGKAREVKEVAVRI